MVCACCPVQACCLHLNAEVSEIAKLLVHAGLRIIEEIGGINLADLVVAALCLGILNSLCEHVVVCACSKLSGNSVCVSIVGVAGCRLCDDNVLCIYAHIQSAGRADADDGLHTELAVELMCVNADGRNAHAVTHNGNSLSLVCSGEAQHVAGVVEADHVGHELLGNGLCAKRIARHQNNLCELILYYDTCGNTFSRFHILFLLNL